MAKISNIFKEEPKKAELHPRRVTRWIHYTKLTDNPAQYRYGKTAEEKEALKESIRQKEEALADLIEADGEVLQDLLVRKTNTDEYEIIAGHHRKNACRILVEERGLEQYAMLPCIVKEFSDIRAQFSCYSSNGYAKKTEYEIMCELEGMSHLLRTYPEEFPNLPSGRLADKLAAQLQMSKSTIGEYRTIANNLGEKGMQAFQSGNLKKSAAVEMATLPEEEQEELLEKGITNHKEIKQYKKTREEVKEVPNFETAPCIRFDTEEECNNFLDNYRSWQVWDRNKLTGETCYRCEIGKGTAIILREYKWTSFQKESYACDYFLWQPEMHFFRDASCMREDLIKQLLKEQS